MFIVRFRFGFHDRCESAKFNSVSDILYNTPVGAESEIRDNDYNPLLWKAFESSPLLASMSLRLEKSTMQEIWQQVSENKTIYGRLWSFGV